MEIAVNEEV